ncbi:MAG TPA: inositol monophosphatase family protein [Spirochaetia bacterium]|nr:inositol monophosphatase family protein [Spirochaetia bacterium]
MIEPDRSELLSVATAAAEKASKVHNDLAEKGFSVAPKGSSRDRVTDADYQAEETIVAAIRSRFPDHNIVAEENSYEKTASDYCWYIDPLDGTVNYSRGLPYFSVSIAVALRGELLAAVVRDSSTAETFAAVKEGGAFRNNSRIWTSRIEDYIDAILISGFFYQDSKSTDENLRTIGRLFEKRVISVRRLGSAALDMCQVACGRVEAYWQSRLNVWDFAAGKLILEEAGGRVSDSAGQPVPLSAGYIVASNGAFHDKLLAVINE